MQQPFLAKKRPLTPFSANQGYIESDTRPIAKMHARKKQNTVERVCALCVSCFILDAAFVLLISQHTANLLADNQSTLMAP